jgi:hypothetical protein
MRNFSCAIMTFSVPVKRVRISALHALNLRTIDNEVAAGVVVTFVAIRREIVRRCVIVEHAYDTSQHHRHLTDHNLAIQRPTEVLEVSRRERVPLRLRAVRWQLKDIVRDVDAHGRPVPVLQTSRKSFLKERACARALLLT